MNATFITGLLIGATVASFAVTLVLVWAKNYPPNHVKEAEQVNAESVKLMAQRNMLDREKVEVLKEISRNLTHVRSVRRPRVAQPDLPPQT